ncbi:MAG: hypothetical protein AAF683_05815 [Pseudomonadota bacterium]
METRDIRLVTGNSSWWKARKYRRETARKLLSLRAAGWRISSKRVHRSEGPDTRRFTVYTLHRRIAESATELEP